MRVINIDIKNDDDIKTLEELMWGKTELEVSKKLSIIFLGKSKFDVYYFVTNVIKKYILTRFTTVIDNDRFTYSQYMYNHIVSNIKRKILTTHTLDTVNKALLDDADVLINIVNDELGE